MPALHPRCLSESWQRRRGNCLDAWPQQSSPICKRTAIAPG